MLLIIRRLRNILKLADQHTHGMSRLRSAVVRPGCSSYLDKDLFEVPSLRSTPKPRAPIGRFIWRLLETLRLFGNRQRMVWAVVVVLIVVVVVLRVCCDSWWFCRGFSRQRLLFRSGLSLRSYTLVLKVDIQPTMFNVLLSAEWSSCRRS